VPFASYSPYPPPPLRYLIHPEKFAKVECGQKPMMMPCRVAPYAQTDSQGGKQSGAGPAMGRPDCSIS
jgi:hypothetical protein